MFEREAKERMSRAKKLFLVVEDFEDSRFMMRRLLEMAGYEVVEATDGEEAVLLAVSTRPAVILMDLSLPKFRRPGSYAPDSPEAWTEAGPIVAVSAHDSIESRNEALAAGCNDYVTKPIDFDRLNHLLQKFVGAPAR